MPRHRRGWVISGESRKEHLLSSLMGSLLEPSILALLNEEPQHGYTLLSNILKIGMPSPHPSVVYRVLRDMELLGWINSSWNSDNSKGPPRRIYTITHIGQSALKNWVDEMRDTNILIESLLKRIQLKGE